MTASSQDTEARQSQSSTRRWAPACRPGLLLCLAIVLTSAVLGSLLHRCTFHCACCLLPQSKEEVHSSLLLLQAKTTKKIVLRLQCQTCKAVHMHPIKVRLGVSVSSCPAWLAVACCQERLLHDARLAVPSLDHGQCHLQRCKHFEIGGDTKKKNQVCFDVGSGGCRHVIKMLLCLSLLLHVSPTFPVRP